MPLGFNLERKPEQPLYFLVVASSPHGSLDIYFSVRQQARPYLAVRGQSKAPAGRAEMLCDGADEAYHPPYAGYLVVLRGSGPRSRCERHEAADRALDNFAHLVPGHAYIGIPAVSGADRHEFDKADV